MLKKSIVKNLKSIVGDKNAILEKDELKGFSVDEIAPQIVLFPDNIDQVSEIMKIASKDSLSVVPRGAGTKSALGNKPENCDIVISTKQLNRITEHGASDLVATAECGISLVELQKKLNNENQFLAVDPPHIDKGATIGGIIASNDSGPERLRYGTVREFLIGITVVKADGTIFKGGSKVVKNVAGYDLPKLYIGSLGTLGIIVDATFRLYPVPEYSETYIASFSNLADCQDVILSLLNSHLVLTSLELMNPQLAGFISSDNDLDLDSANYCLAIGIRNVEKAVGDQISTIKKICSEKNGNGFIVTSLKEEQLWNGIRNFPWKIANADSVVCKASFLVSQIPLVLNNIKHISDEIGVESSISVRAGNGICMIGLIGDAISISNTINNLRNFLSTIQGSLIIQESPIEIKEQFDVWGDIGSGLEIMKRIKSNFDPQNILNPGRYI